MHQSGTTLMCKVANQSRDAAETCNTGNVHYQNAAITAFVIAEMCHCWFVKSKKIPVPAQATNE